jgi:hypothetical protein
VRYKPLSTDRSTADVNTVTGIVHLLHLPLLLHQDVVIMSRFNMDEMLKTIAAFKCEELWLVPRKDSTQASIAIQLTDSRGIQRSSSVSFLTPR